MSDSKELRLRMREEDALERFLDAWRKLPPLVRAATAEHLRLEAVRSLQQHRREEENARKTGLRRRSAVHRAFVTAYTDMHTLWCELCAVADQEADSLGQGPLVRAADLLETPPLVIDKERVEKQITDLLATAIPGETVSEQIETEFARRDLERLKREEDEMLKRAKTVASSDAWPGSAADALKEQPKQGAAHPHCWKCQQPFRPAYAPLPPDTLVPSCKCEWINETKAEGTARYTELCTALEIDPRAYVSLHETALARIQELKAQRALYHEGVRKYDEIINALGFQTRSGVTFRQHADVLKYIKTSREAKKEST